MINRLRMAFKEAFRNIFRGGSMFIIAVLIVTVALSVFGTFVMVAMNLKNVSLMINDKMDVMVYMKQGTIVAELEQVKQKLVATPGVKKIQFVSKEEAWQRFKTNYAQLELAEFVENNPLPDAFRVSVDDLDYVTVLISRTKQIPQVDDIRYGKDVATKMKQLVFVINIVGLLLVVILFFATLMIVINTIRMTIIARQQEIDIMLLVGATRSFITLPFIIEGLIIGCLGGIISVIAMISTYSVVIANIQKKMVFIPLSLTEGDLITVYFIVLFFGLILGIIGSSFSANKAIKME